MKLTASLLAIVLGVPLVLAMLMGWERPPMNSTQLGPRGLGMVEINNPRRQEMLAALNQALAIDDPATPSGIKAKDNPEFKNIKVLGELDTEEFNRLMLAITNWVAPQEGENCWLQLLPQSRKSRG